MLPSSGRAKTTASRATTAAANTRSGCEAASVLRCALAAVSPASGVVGRWFIAGTPWCACRRPRPPTAGARPERWRSARSRAGHELAQLKAGSGNGSRSRVELDRAPHVLQLGGSAGPTDLQLLDGEPVNIDPRGVRWNCHLCSSLARPPCATSGSAAQARRRVGGPRPGLLHPRRVPIGRRERAEVSSSDCWRRGTRLQERDPARVAPQFCLAAVKFAASPSKTSHTSSAMAAVMSHSPSTGRNFVLLSDAELSPWTQCSARRSIDRPTVWPTRPRSPRLGKGRHHQKGHSDQRPC